MNGLGRGLRCPRASIVVVAIKGAVLQLGEVSGGPLRPICALGSAPYSVLHHLTQS